MAQQQQQPSSASLSSVVLPLDCINNIIFDGNISTTTLLGRFSLTNHQYYQHVQHKYQHTKNLFVWLRFSVKGLLKGPRIVTHLRVNIQVESKGINSVHSIGYQDEPTSWSRTSYTLYDQIPANSFLPTFMSTTKLSQALIGLHSALIKWIVKDGENGFLYSSLLRTTLATRGSDLTPPKIDLEAHPSGRLDLYSQNVEYGIYVGFKTEFGGAYISLHFHSTPLALFDYVLQHPGEFVARFRVASPPPYGNVADCSSMGHSVIFLT